MAAPTNPQLSAERIVDPEGFERKVRRALAAHKGDVTEAARTLGISRRTLTRYIEDNKNLQKTLKGVRRAADADKKYRNGKAKAKATK